MEIDLNNTLFDTGDIPVKKGIISDGQLRTIRIVVVVFICQALNIFGVVSNIINMIVFNRIGFSDTINISLCALAVSDLGSCFTLVWWAIANNPWFVDGTSSFHVDLVEISYLSAAWPHILFARITTIITAFIALERCLCVVFPLKVKTIITRTVIKIAVASAFLFGLAAYIPLLYVNRYESKYYSAQNRTRIGLVFSPDREEVESIFFPITDMLVPCAAFGVIVFSTAFLAISLKKNSKWKKTALASTQNSETTKEERVAKIVIMISGLFIVSFFPEVAGMVTITIERRISITGQFRNFMYAYGACAFVLQVVNSSCNIFIYYYNSSIYYNTFRTIFRLKDNAKM